MFTPKTTYATYIVASPHTVWQALTDPHYTRQYFFGRTIESDWQVGSQVVYRMEDGQVDVQGKLISCDKPHRLSFTWHVEWMEEYRKLPEALVTFEIQAFDEVVRLQVTEAHSWDISDELLEGGRQGWPVILSGLKTLLETGKSMPLPDFP